ncbi:ABC transporter permease [Acinetobacter sp. CUI P1]|nr:ABC transporter permease [Acinetobacter sp. CUI P1]
MNKGKPKGFMRFDWPFHFVTMPLALILFVWSAIYAVQEIRDDGALTVPLLLFGMSLCLLFAITRIRIYATKNQDRVVRVEEQFRYFRLTGEALSPELEIAQIIALRYAGDDEFSALCQRAVNEKLNPADIRSAIKNWREDKMRV